MELLLKKLQPFMKIPERATLTSKQSMDEANIFDLKSDYSGESLGIVQLTQDGRLKMFGEFPQDEGESKETITKENIGLITESFLQEFFPKALPKLYLDSVIDLEYFYVFEYVQKDEQFNLPMPNSGICFYMFKNGSIMDMTCHMDGITVVYPEDIITTELATKIFLDTISPELKIMQFDNETYLNGDNSLALVYDFIENVGIDVKMDGTKTTPEELGAEITQHLTISEAMVDTAPIYSYINLEDMQKIFVDGPIEVWSTLPLQHYREHEDFDNEDLTDMDFGIVDAIKIKMGPERGTLKQLIALSDEDAPNLHSVESAYDKALQILFSQFSDAHLSFKKRESEPTLSYFDDEGEELPPYAYQFTFDRFEKDVQVVGESIAITISANNLELIEYDATDSVYNDFSNLIDSTPTNAKKAMELYEQSFDMKLHWAKDYVDDMETSQYELVYLPVFEGSGGHVHFINANTLELWVVDIGECE